MASLFKVKALYDFEAKEEDDLGFPSGQIIDVTEEVDGNWLEGKYTDVTGSSKAGIFPREFVERYEPEIPARPTRPARAKQEVVPAAVVSAPAPALAPAPVQAPTPASESEDEEDEEEREVPVAPAAPKPQRTSAEIPSTSGVAREIRSPTSPVVRQESVTKPELPPAPKPTPAEPVVTSTKKSPPPIASKSNAFRDRIAAFNQPAAAPVAPIQPGGPKAQSTGFIKKPFVAPPPSANAYVPPPKADPVHRPYVREEDPEIKRRQEEDREAAENAGLAGNVPPEQQEEEDAPKPQSLKERIARLQQQQMEQAQRKMETTHKKEKKPPSRQLSESTEQAAPVEAEAEAEDEETEHAEGEDAIERRQSSDLVRDLPRVSSIQRQPADAATSIPPIPDHEILSDGNEADHSAVGETTEDDMGTIGPGDSDDRPAPPPRAAAAPRTGSEEVEKGDSVEGSEDEEDEMDEETRRRLELRERMAKMSGGMGMTAMFGPPGGIPMPGAPPKKKSPKEQKSSEEAVPSSPPQQRIPMIPMPGIPRVQSPDNDRTPMPTEMDEEPLAGDREPEIHGSKNTALPERPIAPQSRGPPPPVPKDSHPTKTSTQDRDLPPPVPGTATTSRPPPPEARPVPPVPPTATTLSPDSESESDDEMPVPRKPSVDASGVETPGPLPERTEPGKPPPIPGSREARPMSMQPSEGSQPSYFGAEPSAPAENNRASRGPPPVPGSTSVRPPPPPPPSQGPPSRRTTEQYAQDEDERGESEYEGDYDTDIASSAKHKDALKSHAREPSLDDSTTADDTPFNSPLQPPQTFAPRSVPPPPPSQAPPKSRPSGDFPRAPPPAPPHRDFGPAIDDEDYDPYRYEARNARSPSGIPPITAPPIPPRETERSLESSADDIHRSPPVRRSTDRAPPPPPPPQDRPVPAPPTTEAPSAMRASRQSSDMHRSGTVQRRSTEQPILSGEHGQIATDIDLRQDTPWWTSPKPLPPSLQSRNGVDILSESEESTTSKRGGRTTISKDIYVLFTDYSQTIITARYDSREASDVTLEQRHEPPPPKLRQAQLEAYWQRFGRNIAEAASSLGHSKKESTVGDGASMSLVTELVKSHPAALLPVGTRTFGALVYANMANASTMQFDEIRPGDIITVRNAKFEGHHGAMKSRYKQEYGPNHVAIVEEWDGTKRAIRAWEQGREKKSGVRSDKLRLGDLRSGEIRVWRVVGREWVGWDDGS